MNQCLTTLKNADAVARRDRRTRRRSCAWSRLPLLLPSRSARPTSRRASSSWSRLKAPSVRFVRLSWPVIGSPRSARIGWLNSTSGPQLVRELGPLAFHDRPHLIGDCRYALAPASQLLFRCNPNLGILKDGQERSMQRPRRAAWQRNGWRTVKGARDDGRHCPMHVDAAPEARSMAAQRLANG